MLLPGRDAGLTHHSRIFNVGARVRISMLHFGLTSKYTLAAVLDKEIPLSGSLRICYHILINKIIGSVLKTRPNSMKP